MAFQLPDDLAPEVYPLSWLLGTWRGPGFVAYPGISQRPVLVEAVFGHDGGPYLTYESTVWLLDGELESLEAEVDVGALQAGEVWSTEAGFWRVAADVPDDARSLTEPESGSARHGERREIEVLLSDPAGYSSVLLGAVAGPRIELSTDLVARTATGADVSAAQRMYGLVGGELMWATDLAAFGQPLQSYSSGRLQRQD